MKLSSIMAALAAFLFIAALANPAQARGYKHHDYRHPARHHAARIHVASINATERCSLDNNGRTICAGQARSTQERAAGRRAYRVERSGVTFIPNPPGAWRVSQSCAQRLAAYWRLGKGLDAVSTWPRVFARAGGPEVGIAAVRHDRHHIMGIIGGGPGAWRVADFNSGGHRNREYTVASFGGYFFVDPRTRMASR